MSAGLTGVQNARAYITHEQRLEFEPKLRTA